MPVSQRIEIPPHVLNGDALRDAQRRYGNAFLRTDPPDHRLPAVGMSAADAMRPLGRGVGARRTSAWMLPAYTLASDAET